MDSSHALSTTETFAGQAVEIPWWRRMATRILNGPTISLGILAALVFVAVFADFLAPYPYNGTSRYTPEVGELRNKYLPPMWQARGKPQFILGTDQQGRDILSRLIYGSRISAQGRRGRRARVRDHRHRLRHPLGLYRRMGGSWSS